MYKYDTSEAVVLHEFIEPHAMSTLKPLMTTGELVSFKIWHFQNFSKNESPEKLETLFHLIKSQVSDTPLGQSHTSNTYLVASEFISYT